jgi:copper(I)-binding protein
MEAGMARMRPAGALVVGPKATVTAEPGGLHLMLVDLKSPLVAGTSVPLVLRFQSAGEITVQLQIEPQDSAPHH